MRKLFVNIKELIQVRDASISFLRGKEMNELPTLKKAYLVVEGGCIFDFGTMDNCPEFSKDEVIDCTGKMILPTWCDSHTHLVYAGSRESEFVDRIKGATYEEIAAKGGGILNSAKKLQKTTENDLYFSSAERLERVISLGTGAIEIKSGYGLTVEAELKMLRLIKRLKKSYDLPIKSTFLGAHAIPSKFKSDKQAYIDLIINEMLPAIADEGLADFMDVFCEKGYFSVNDMEKLLKAGATYGLVPKVHVNQFNALGGVEAAVRHKALSVDHLEILTDADIKALQGSSTMPVGLPGCSFFLGIPYTPARRLIDAGLPFALASDYNPGSAPSGNMNFVVAAGCIHMKLTPEEAINAATLNAAYAMGLSDSVGSITRGKLANLILTRPIPSYGYIPYAFGDNCIEQVYISGKEQL